LRDSGFNYLGVFEVTYSGSQHIGMANHLKMNETIFYLNELVGKVVFSMD